MGQKRRLLVTLAIAGWIGAAILHVLASQPINTPDRERRRTQRNLLLLFSSVCMNTAVASYLIHRCIRFIRG